MKLLLTHIIVHVHLFRLSDCASPLFTMFTYPNLACLWSLGPMGAWMQRNIAYLLRKLTKSTYPCIRGQQIIKWPSFGVHFTLLMLKQKPSVFIQQISFRFSKSWPLDWLCDVSRASTWLNQRYADNLVLARDSITDRAHKGKTMYTWLSLIFLCFSLL